jgi:hypothetical protein
MPDEPNLNEGILRELSGKGYDMNDPYAREVLESLGLIKGTEPATPAPAKKDEGDTKIEFPAHNGGDEPAEPEEHDEPIDLSGIDAAQPQAPAEPQAKDSDTPVPGQTIPLPKDLKGPLESIVQKKEPAQPPHPEPARPEPVPVQEPLKPVAPVYQPQPAKEAEQPAQPDAAQPGAPVRQSYGQRVRQIIKGWRQKYLPFGQTQEAPGEKKPQSRVKTYVGISVAAAALAAALGLLAPERTSTLTYRGKEWAFPARDKKTMSAFMETEGKDTIEQKLYAADIVDSKDGKPDYCISREGMSVLK